ncbi:hypothetical protein [Croceicoccus naphthovorans]|uniref:Uncharacterized protein n=1 Tax=Croceicoccus naphthovorans TaxID=1348774 RepID=A0A0G3XDP6_9SPHN|nr:hypothetical protein [Croceicoccus naphthovorans]AKM09317.1 hypothetical protein AB433_03910 [Croceicoccus naphthovorans]MBB3990225.1 hypothetical protein [Croceicoccus naphthovorans]
MNLPQLSNRAIALARDDLEAILQGLTAMQEVSGRAAAIILERLNEADGDPDTEDDDPAESDGTDQDLAWLEWQNMHPSTRSGPNRTAGHEDAEDDDPDTGVEDNPLGIDPEEDCCPAGDDRIMSGAVVRGGGFYVETGAGDEIDAEREQMQDDVPMLATYSLDYNLFSDERQFLGIGNLTASFRTNGGEVLSADTGKTLVTKATDDLRKPGDPA